MNNGFAQMRLCGGDAPRVVAVAAGPRVQVLNAVGGDRLERAVPYGRVNGEDSAAVLTQRDVCGARCGTSHGFGLSASRRKPYPRAQTRSNHDDRGLCTAL